LNYDYHPYIIASVFGKYNATNRIIKRIGVVKILSERSKNGFI